MIEEPTGSGHLPLMPEQPTGNRESAQAIEANAAEDVGSQIGDVDQEVDQGLPTGDEAVADLARKANRDGAMLENGAAYPGHLEDEE